MNQNQLESPRHSSVRRFLRIIGPVMAGIGLALMLIGFISFFVSFGGSGPPRYFWCAFLGMPLLFFGGVMCQFAYMGALQRYMAAESAPVAKDVVNYMGENTQPGVKAVAKAVTEGILDAQKRQPPAPGAGA